MQEERYSTRDLTYSAWHRRLSTRRFVGIEKAQSLAMIDLDCALYIEYDDGSKKPVALIETAIDVGQKYKAATVVMNLAKMSGLPCYCVLYTCANDPNPANPLMPDISQFRVKRLWPRPEKLWRQIEPAEWANALVQIRTWSAKRIDKAANDSMY
jgi:hypothetical protein